MKARLSGTADCKRYCRGTGNAAKVVYLSRRITYLKSCRFALERWFITASSSAPDREDEPSELRLNKRSGYKVQIVRQGGEQ